MAFENVRSILRIGSPSSSFKLLLLAASRSRPRYRALCLGLLRPFVRGGEISLRYRCYDRYLRCFIGLSDMESDLISVLELSVRDTYELDFSFKPDLVIDGGGNIGLFTLRAAAGLARGGDSAARFIVCEPLPRNLDQIRKHLAINEISAEVMAGCLGGERRSIPFYCREAIDSSFEPDKPYTSVVEIPVYTLQDAIGSYAAKRILIKLDIEGMEMEVLGSYVPWEHRPVYVVGELHSFAMNAPTLRRTFEENGWGFEFCEIANDHATFRACSPAAAPLLTWMAHVGRPAPIS
jgi:FkbM family methyltransferase